MTMTMTILEEDRRRTMKGATLLLLLLFLNIPTIVFVGRNGNVLLSLLWLWLWWTPSVAVEEAKALVVLRFVVDLLDAQVLVGVSSCRDISTISIRPKDYLRPELLHFGGCWKCHK